MKHGNKKYFFEQLESVDDTLIIKPQIGQIRVNTTSLKQQMKLYQKEAGAFNYDLLENKNGSVTLTRIDKNA